MSGKIFAKDFRLDVRYHADFQNFFLYLPAGTSAIDGSSLWYAAPLTPRESLLWQRGELAKLMERLRNRGIPIPGACGLREGKFRKFLRGLKTKLIGG